MRYVFVKAYEIRGLNHTPGQADVTLFTKEGDPSVSAILTDNPDKYCYEIDRAQCLGHFMLAGFTGQPSSVRLELENYILQVRVNRKRQFGTSEVLVFIAEGEIEADLSKSVADKGDYIIGFDIINKQQIAGSLSGEIEASLAGLCLAANHEMLQIKRLAQGAYLLSASEKPIYSFSMSCGGEAYTSRTTTDELIDQTRKYLSSLAIDTGLSRVYKLFIQSISIDNDVLRRFIFSWSALEILINKVFSKYEKLFVQNHLGDKPADQTHRYFNRIQDIPKDKYPLLDKFVVIATCIGNESVEGDIESFHKIKKTRDTFFHGEPMDEKSLPVSETIGLLKKYIRCHIDATKPRSESSF